ncbi:MAG: hypothetical protein CMC08_03370 [Flavobacteriaceae bacterium]|nr:hypothetical protein [Flavobacteriaceae bacterium]|tara:strand:- start:109 stop:612 length:504 start_codon:yes stop_codon:yes gene_type:complete
MRNYRIVLPFIAFLLFIFTSCQNEEIQSLDSDSIDLVIQKNEDAKIINQLLADAKVDLENQSRNLNEFQNITFEVVKNLETNEITLQNFEEKSFFPIASKEKYQSRSGGYQVDCDLGGPPNDWSEECSGKWSCGQLIADCLDQGGCATVCERNPTGQFASVLVTYIP